MFGKQITIDDKKIEELLSRRMGDYEGRPNIWPSKEEAQKKLKEGKQLRVYLGIDPTGPDLHLGHTIPLLFLKQLWELGHKPVLVIGDFTAQVGDPTGKESTRKALTKKEVKINMKNYLGQVRKLLPKFEVKYNSSWLSKMPLSEFLNVASHVSMHYLSTRSMHRERIKDNLPFAVHEFLYPVLQGYDSVAMNIDGEVGGSDQTFNMLIGKDLMKDLCNKEKLVFGTRLLVDAESGKKMSKTEGGLITLSDLPQDMFGKVMKTVPDAMIVTVFELCTEKPLEWIESEKNKDPYEFKKELAFELVKMYHSEKDAQKAKEEWEKVFSKGELPTEMEEVEATKLVDLVGLVMHGSASSAKILIDQGAVRVNGEAKKEWNFTPQKGDVVQIGPRKFLKIK